jgi:NodT family efflux transporter outer membrane factor (OMF) lipoprotein
MNRRLAALTAMSAALLASCSMVPHYDRPKVAIPAGFKEEPGWRVATPSDAVARGAWWQLFPDPVLDDLEQRVARNNQNIAAAVAAYDQARAAVREQRAALFPTVDLSLGATRAGSFGNGAVTIQGNGANSGNSSSGGTSKRYSASVGASWEPDLWGRIRAGVKQAGALAEASKGDLLGATLSAQGELALDYLQLRAIDARSDLLKATLAAYQRNFQITTNRYNAGVVAKVDVLQAQTQLVSARADANDLARQRAILEHAIAVLVGETPSSFSLAPARWAPVVPAVPSIVPASLLERRPDVAAAERRVVAANAAIGIERAAFFPTFNLNGNVGAQSSNLGSLFTAASSLWSFGLTGALTLLDFGARSARVAQARATYIQAVANYRQTALTAFQDIEDQLAANRILALVGNDRTAASAAANRVEQLTFNQYLAGQISYTDVITVQTTALNARVTALNATLDRQTAAVALIQALGGSWVEPPPAKP